MRRSETIKEFAQAMSQLQGSLPTPRSTKPVEVKGVSKSGRAYGYKYSYAPLSEVIQVLQPELLKHGLSFVQDLTVEYHEENTSVTVVTTIFHSSGEWIEFSPYLIWADDRSTQRVAAAGTSARRHDLRAAFGIAEEEDLPPDANERDLQPPKQSPPKQSPPKPPKQSPPAASITDAYATIHTLLADMSQETQKASLKRHLGSEVLEDCRDIEKLRRYYKAVVRELEQEYTMIDAMFKTYGVNQYEQKASLKKHLGSEVLEDCRDIGKLRRYREYKEARQKEKENAK